MVDSFDIIIVALFAIIFFIIIFNFNKNKNKNIEKTEPKILDRQPELKRMKKRPEPKRTKRQSKSKPKSKKIKKQPKLEHKKNKEDLVYLEVSENREILGKVIIRLNSEIVPKTCKNFRELCRMKKYINSPFHRIIKDFMIQGGDFTNGNGTGGMSIYGNKFEDENFHLQHDMPYILSMANSGPDTNGSQFFITTIETPHLDGKHVVFGYVIDGHDIIDYLNNIETDHKDRPTNNINISDCGIL